MTSTNTAGISERRSSGGGQERSAIRSPVSGIAVALLLAGILVVLSLGLALNWSSRGKPVVFSTVYQGVLLSNGSVYFGKLEGYGGPTPVLTDAFYVVSRTDPDTKQVSNILVKRGKELHGPDRMFLNPSQIVFVETVGSTSKVGQLIAQSGAQ